MHSFSLAIYLVWELIDEFLAWHISGVARCYLTFPWESLSFCSIVLLRTFWRTTVICVAYSDLKKLNWQKNGINSWTFSFDHCLQLSTWLITTLYIDELKYLYGVEAPSNCTMINWLNEFNRGRPSLKDEVREVYQKKILCRSTLMPCVNW